jgi:signal transduction histidine kinase/HAMP domain-containing protein
LQISLKTRLSLSIVALVMGVVIALSALNLYSVATAKFGDLEERATTAALQVQSLLLQRIGERTTGKPVPATLKDQKALWADVVATDEELSTLLSDTMASSHTILEIEVAGETGRILASSNPSSVGRTIQKLPSLGAWVKKEPWAQLAEIFTERLNYEVVLPLGVPGEESAVFRIQVIISSVLLRNSLAPQVDSLTKAVIVSILAAILLAVIASKIAFRPLARIGDAIDRMARGEFRSDTGEETKESKEVAAVQSKLNVLGQQFRGAREDAVELRGNIGQLLERLEGAVLLFDKNDRLIMAGSAVENRLGRGRWELMGRPLSELFPTATPLGAAVQLAVQFRRPLKDRPFAFERDGQSPAQVLASVELLEDFPRRDKLGTLITLRDAETRSQLQSQLDISTRLAAISRLTGGVAHEIKNPLNAIALHLEVLKAKTGDAGPEAEKVIRIIASEIARLDRVVKTFLDFNKPVELKRREISLSQIAREVAALVQPEGRKRSVQVAVEAEEEALMRGDFDLIKQAVLNVVMNGVEAMKTSGRVTIRVEKAAEDCVIGVSDEGAGIPPEIREKIFNLYFTTKGKGSGIGLAMTFRVVQLHGGTIDFSSELQKGTTFWLRFPAIAGGSGSGAETPAAKPEQSSGDADSGLKTRA